MVSQISTALSAVLNSNTANHESSFPQRSAQFSHHHTVYTNSLCSSLCLSIWYACTHAKAVGDLPPAVALIWLLYALLHISYFILWLMYHLVTRRSTRHILLCLYFIIHQKFHLNISTIFRVPFPLKFCSNSTKLVICTIFKVKVQSSQS